MSRTRRRHRDPLGLAAAATLCVIVVASLLADVIAPHSPDATRMDLIYAPIGSEYLLGGDGAGRDILSRLLHAGRTTLLGALTATCVACVLGVAGGLIAGYAGRAVDLIANAASEVLLALPAMIVLLGLFRVTGSSLPATMAVLGVLLAPGMFRLVRGLVRQVCAEQYIDAARVAGLGGPRIVVGHVLRAIRGPVILQASLITALAVTMQAGLEFIGLGAAGTATWGGMLDDAFGAVYIAPLSMLWPGLLITLTAAAVLLLGNALRDALDPGVLPVRSAPRPTREGAPPAPEVDALLSIRGLRIAYDDAGEIVHGVDLDVRRGEVLGLVGVSGSGKSQTAFAVLSLLGRGGHRTAGTIRFDGTDLTASSPARLRRLRGTRIAYVPQDPMTGLDPAFRIGTQLVEPMRVVQRMTRRQAESRARTLLARVGIADPERVLRCHPHELSGGMAQRVLIAGALASDPDLLIADEVTASLDVTVQADVLDLLRDLQRERGMAVLLITHDLGVAADLCDRIAVMHAGRVVETGEITEFFEDPQHPHSRELLAAEGADP